MSRTPCTTCLKPPATCYCAALRPFAIGFELVILIHPQELRRRIGTGRMAHLAVRGSRLVVGESFRDDSRVAALLADASLAPSVLYPGRQALDLTTATPAEAERVFPRGRRPLVFVVDGTWRSARKMLHLSPNITALPQLRFTPPHLSGFGAVRSQPSPECWSTIESIHHMIDRLDALGVATAPPERAHDHLLALFGNLVAQQEAYEADARAARDHVVRGVRTGAGAT